MTTFIISCSGDPSVGIPGQNAEVRLWVPADEPEYLAFVKAQLTQAFSAIWDERVSVLTEDECACESE